MACEFKSFLTLQWKLGNSNARFSKTTNSPDFFHCNLLQNITDFLNFKFLKKLIF